MRGGGGGDHGHLPAPVRAEPHVDLVGTWGRFGFCGGGRVHAAGADVARVRLHFGDQVECEDDTETGWVLFYSPRPLQRPHAAIELLDAAGDIVTTYPWPPQRDLTQVLLARIPQS